MVVQFYNRFWFLINVREFLKNKRGKQRGDFQFRGRRVSLEVCFYGVQVIRELGKGRVQMWQYDLGMGIQVIWWFFLDRFFFFQVLQRGGNGNILVFGLGFMFWQFSGVGNMFFVERGGYFFYIGIFDVDIFQVISILFLFQGLVRFVGSDFWV